VSWWLVCADSMNGLFCILLLQSW